MTELLENLISVTRELEKINEQRERAAEKLPPSHERDEQLMEAEWISAQIGKAKEAIQKATI